MIQMPPARLGREVRRAEENLALDREANQRWKRYVAAGALMVLAGIAVSGAGFAVSDYEMGNVLLLGGLTLGNVGVLAIVMIYTWNND